MRASLTPVFLIFFAAATQGWKLHISPNGDRLSNRKSGDNFLVVCSVQDFDGAASDVKVEWFKGEEHIKMGRVMAIPKPLSNQLMIVKARKEDSAEYICRAEIDGQTQEATAHINFIRAPEFVDAAPEQHPEDGETAEILCRVTGEPALEIFWQFNGNTLDEASPRGYEFKDNNQILVIPKYDSKKDDGVYLCNAAQFSSFETQTINVSGYSRPKITVFDGPENNRGFEGRPVQFQCAATGKPKPTYKWFKVEDEEEITKSDLYNVDDGLLVIHALSNTDSGDYRCEASNAIGQDNRTVTLSVFLRPKVERISNETKQEKESVELVCKYAGDGEMKAKFIYGDQEYTVLSETEEDASEETDNNDEAAKDNEKEETEADEEEKDGDNGEDENDDDESSEKDENEKEDEEKEEEDEQENDGEKEEEEENTTEANSQEEEEKQENDDNNGEEEKNETEEAEEEEVTTVDDADEDEEDHHTENHHDDHHDDHHDHEDEKADDNGEDEEANEADADDEDAQETLRWKRDITSGRVSVRAEDNSLILTINDLQQSDAGAYQCVVENEAGPVTRTTHLAITHAPVMKNWTDHKVRSFDGHEVELVCSAKAVPAPQWSWILDGTEIEADGTSLRIDSHGETTRLHLRTSAGRYGKYICKAENGVGEAAEKTIEVIEVFIPSAPTTLNCQDHVYPNYGSCTFGDDAYADEKTRPTEVEFFFARASAVNGEFDWDKDALTTKVDYSERMKISGLTTNTGYIVRAKVINEAGESEMGVQGTIETTDAWAPERPESVNVECDDVCMVSWIEPNNHGSEITGYKITIREYTQEENSDEKEYVGNSLEIAVGSSDEAVELTQLKPSARYEVSVSATNEIGSSDPRVTAFETPATLSPLAGEGLSSTQLIVIVGGVLLLLCVILDVICFATNRCGIISCICINCFGRTQDRKQKDLEAGNRPESNRLLDENNTSQSSKLRSPVTTSV